MSGLAEVFGAEHGRVVASLARRLGDLDRIRREKRGREKYAEHAMTIDDTSSAPTGPVTDDRLRLAFICCHPALAMENRVALTLRPLGGLSVCEIAAAFLVPETTMAQRITRAKAKIKAAHIPYRIPSAEDLPGRLTGVLAVLYLVFNEGLLALMLLTEARRAARFADGELVSLEKQDRACWDAALIDEGHRLVRGCLALNRPGPYQLQAAVNAVHTDALDASLTDWSQVVRLYDQPLSQTTSPVVALNRAVAVAELDGPEVALALVEPLPLTGYHAWWATRADLLRRLGRHQLANEAYGAAIELADNPAERAWLARRRDELPATG